MQSWSTEKIRYKWSVSGPVVFQRSPILRNNVDDFDESSYQYTGFFMFELANSKTSAG